MPSNTARTSAQTRAGGPCRCRKRCLLRLAACGPALGGRSLVVLGGLVAAQRADAAEDSDDVARLALGAADHKKRDEEEEGEDETEERHKEDEHSRLVNAWVGF
eukprot:scaffold97450_cov68-Phaeocystis_antarctica.AAC.1